MNPDHVTITGQGPAILSVHGWGQSRASMAPLADALSGGHRVINIDLPGHGAARGLPGPHTFPRYMEWISQMAKEHAEGQFHLLGWSMGGAIAARYALERLTPIPSSLVLLAAPARFIAPKGSGMGQTLSAIERLRAQLTADHTAALRTFIEFFFMSGELIEPEMEAPIRAALTPSGAFPPDKEALLATLGELTELDLTRHRAIPSFVRGLIINGTLDRICPVAGQALWDGIFSDLSWSTMDNCGHAPHLTRLADTAAAIDNFLSGS